MSRLPDNVKKASNILLQSLKNYSESIRDMNRSLVQKTGKMRKTITGSGSPGTYFSDIVDTLNQMKAIHSQMQDTLRSLKNLADKTKRCSAYEALKKTKRPYNIGTNYIIKTYNLLSKVDPDLRLTYDTEMSLFRKENAAVLKKSFG